MGLSVCSLSDGFGVVRGKQACFAPQLAFPPRLFGALQDLDDIAGVEFQLIRLFGMETVQSPDLQLGGGFELSSGEEAVQDQT